MTRQVSIPFALGQDESYSPIELPAGPLRECINVRQRALHSLGVRADYPATSMLEYGGTLVPYDLYNLNGRLVALGDRQGKGRPTDLFSFIQQAPANWSGTLAGGSAVNGNNITPVTALRNVGLPQESSGTIGCARIAAVNGVVMLAYGPASSTPGITSYVHIFKASTDETLVASTVSIASPRCVAAGNSLWVIGIDASSHVVGFRFDTTTSISYSAPVQLFNTGTVLSAIYDVDEVKGVAQFVLALRDSSNNILIRRFNEAGVQQQAIAGPLNPGTAIQQLAIEADSVRNRIVLGYHPTGDVLVQTYNFSTGASVAGPTAMFGISTFGGFYMQRLSNGVSGMSLLAENTTFKIQTAVFQEDALGVVVQKTVFNYQLTGRPLMGAGYVIAPMNTKALENELVFVADDSLTITGALLPAAVLDGGAASVFAVSPSLEDGDTCADLTTGKAYWARLAISTDGRAAPFVTEFLAGSTARRVSCQNGNALLIAGGLPILYDGRRSSECGFPERPSFSTVPTATTGGALLPGASYDYVFIWTYLDSLNLVARSKVSDIKSVTLSSVQNAVTMDCFSPHTLRSDNVTLSAPTVEVYRTHADVIATTGVVISLRDFLASPAVAGDFNAKTLQIAMESGGTQTVTFGAADKSVADIVAAINTQTTLCTAAIVGNSFSITTDLAGSAGSVTVVGGTTTDPGVGNLGLFVSQTSAGTSSFVKGTVFQRCATVIMNPLNQLGLAYTVLDTMSDATLLTQVPLYTNAERGALSGILEHEGPPPFEFCTTVGMRVLIGGLSDRSEIRISKELFPGESIAFTGDAAFRARVEGNVTGVACLNGTIPVVFTADSVYVLPSSFPDDNGNNGQLGPPQRLDTEEGCSNALSILVASAGVFYQSRTGKLMVLRPGASNAEWIGRGVQTTMASFPTITGATYVETDNAIVFTAQNLAGNASVNLVFDLLIGQWFKDTFAVAQVIKGCVDFLGRLAYIDGALVRLQSASLVPATFIPYSVKTGSLNPFGGDGWGRLPSVTVPFQFRGNARMRLSVSYDDGRTFAQEKTFEFTTAAGWVADQFDDEQWWPARVKGSSYVLLFEVFADTGGTASEGLILQRYTLELDGAKPSRARLASAQKG